MNYASIISDEEAVKSWLRDYSGELLAVGIKLGLDPLQQTALHDRLLAVRQGFDATTAIKAEFLAKRANRVLENDPMRVRWLNQQISQQGGRCEAA